MDRFTHHAKTGRARERTLDDFILRFTDAHADEVSNEYVVTYRGSVISSAGDAFAETRALEPFVPPNFHEVERWGSMFRRVWVNEVEMAVITYVEGDVSVDIARSRVAWVEQKVEMERFYLLHG